MVVELLLSRGRSQGRRVGQMRRKLLNRAGLGSCQGGRQVVRSRSGHGSPVRHCHHPVHGSLRDRPLRRRDVHRVEERATSRVEVAAKRGGTLAFSLQESFSHFSLRQIKFVDSISLSVGVARVTDGNLGNNAGIQVEVREQNCAKTRDNTKINIICQNAFL